MLNYQLLSAIISILALGGLFITQTSQKYPTWLSLIRAALGGLLISAPVTFLGTQLLTQGFVLNGPLWESLLGQVIIVPYVVLNVAIILFLLSFFGYPNHLALNQKRGSNRSNSVQNLLITLSFSVAYSLNHTLFVTHPRILLLPTIFGVTITGLLGTLAADLLRRWSISLTDWLVKLLMLVRYRGLLIGRLLVSLFLLALAILLPLRNDLDGALDYQVSYESEEGSVSKSLAIDNYLNLALYYRDKGETDTAKALLKQSLIDEPKSYESYVYLADLLIEEQQYQAALDNLNIAISLAPTDTLAYYGRAFVYDSLENYDAAIENLDQIIALEPENSSAYLMRAGLSLHDQRYAQVLADTEKVKELNADERYANIIPLLEGIAYWNLGDYNKGKISLDALKNKRINLIRNYKSIFFIYTSTFF